MITFFLKTIIKFKFVFLLLLISASARANFITLATPEIRSLEQVGPGVSMSTNNASSVLTNYTLNGATFLTFWLFNSDGNSEGSIQTPENWSANWEEFDSFQQQIINRDESPWSFKASIFDGDSIYESETLLLEGIREGQIIPGVSEETLYVDLSTANKSTIEWVRFSVSGDLPVNNYDRVAEYEMLVQFGDINEVPLPASAFLFASALAMMVVRKKSLNYMHSTESMSSYEARL